jgi:hypothetical protein
MERNHGPGEQTPEPTTAQPWGMHWDNELRRMRDSETPMGLRDVVEMLPALLAPAPTAGQPAMVCTGRSIPCVIVTPNRTARLRRHHETSVRRREVPALPPGQCWPIVCRGTRRWRRGRALRLRSHSTRNAARRSATPPGSSSAASRPAASHANRWMRARVRDSYFKHPMGYAMMGHAEAHHRLQCRGLGLP